MGRGVSCGGGQSSLGYLFGSGEADSNTPPPPQNPSDDPTSESSQKPSQPADNNSSNATDKPSQKTPSEPGPVDKINENPDLSAHDSTTNNYYRADGQNCGNFITNRPTTKVHAAPGGSSSLGYLFGDDKK